MCSKNSLRQEILSKRLSLTESQIKRYSDTIYHSVATLIEKHNVKTIGLYYPIQNEVDITPLYQNLWDLNKDLYLPSIKKSRLEFIRFNKDDELITGAYNIPIPKQQNHIIREEIPQFIIIPCVACDTRRFRLGYGKGFYDRFLSQAGKNSFKLGVCYELQLVKNLPAESHDIQLDVIITEKRQLD